MLNALIFDVDGTLAETEEVHRRAFNETFRAEGLPWDWDRALYTDLLRVTGGKERIAHFITAHGAQPALDPAAIARLHLAKTARYTELMAAGDCTLRPGIARIIDEAEAAGLPVAIATTTSLPNVEALLDVTMGAGAARRFAAIGAGDMVTRKKPAPDVYALVLEKLGLPAQQTLAFEDSRNGLLSAGACGIPVVITVSSFTEHEEFPGALVVADTLGEPLAPPRILSGEAPPAGYFDLAALRALHATN